MSPDTISWLAPVISALAAALSAWVAWYVFQHQEKIQQQANREKTLNTFLIEAYVFRPYTRSEHAKQHDFVMERDKVRDAFIANSQSWEKGLDADLIDRVKSEMADSLQQIGLSAFLGAVPLSLVFAVVGDSIVLDWLIVQPYIVQLNATKPILSRKKTHTPVFARRRHAEWLALLTYLWLNLNWDCRKLYGGALEIMKEKIPRSELVKRVEDITYADEELFAASNAASIERLTGILLRY